MNLTKYNFKRSVVLIFTLSLGTLISCQPDEVGTGDGNGLTATNIDASFTVTPVAGEVNTYLLSAQTGGVLLSKWNIGDGEYTGKFAEKISLADAGTYTISHTAVGIGGATATTTKEIVVATSDPLKGNLVQGGKLDTTSDISKWTVLNIASSGTSWAFANGKATVTGGGWNQQGFYQAISVVSGRTYKVDMVCSSTSGVSNTWFEVFVSPIIPTQNSDYSAGGKIRTINTWAGCGTSAFSGKISSVGCDGSSNAGTYTATATETVYLVIKCGGENLKDGISVDNIELRGI